MRQRSAHRDGLRERKSLVAVGVVATTHWLYAERFVLSIFLAYAVASCSLGTVLLKLHVATTYEQSYHVQDAALHLRFECAFVAFGTMAIMSVSVWWLTSQAEKRVVALRVSLSNALCSATYIAFCLGKVPLVAGANPGELVFLHRYTMWLLSTVMLISVLGRLVPDSEAEKKPLLTRAVYFDVAMLLLGCAEECVRGPARWALFLCSSAAFATTVGAQWGLLRLAVSAVDDEDAQPLYSLRRANAITWGVYPLTRLLSHVGLATPAAQEAVFTLVDVAAKVGYTSVLLVAAFEQLEAQNRRSIRETIARRAREGKL